MTKYKAKYVKRKLKKYENAGMYDANTVTAAGQGTAGSSESIVYDEANPQILEAAKNAKLQNDATLAKNADTAIQDINTQKADDEAAIEENAMKAKATNQQVDATVGKGIKTLTNDGKSADVLGNMKDKFVNTKQGIKTAGMKIFKRKAIKEAEKKAAASIAGEGLGNVAREKLANETSAILAEKGTELTINKGSEAAMNWGVDTGVGALQNKVLQESTNAAMKKGASKVGEVVIGKTKDVIVDKTKDVITKKATDKLLEKGTETVVKKGTEALVKKGAEIAVKEGAKGAVASSFNPNPYATAANLAGTAISMGSDDGDATTWNAGEATGDILAKAGSYAGYGAMIGSAVPVIGNAVGAVVGGVVGAGVATWQGIAGRNKARKEKKAAELKAQNKANNQNKKTTKNFMGQMSRVRAEEMKAKTYSGYDLGNNVSARRGGFRALPAYN